jgi:hypothetical protein
VERQQLWALYLGKSKGCAATLSRNQTISWLSREKQLRRHHYYVQKMSVNGASTTFRHASWKIRGQCSDINT